MKQLFLAGSIAALFVCGAGPADAANGWLTAYKAALDHAHTAEAQTIAEAEAREDPSNRAAHFAAGTAHFLATVEAFGRDMHRYGLRSTYSSWLLGGLPFVSLPVAANPTPEPVTYEKLRETLRKLADGLAAAEAELAAVPAGPLALRLDLATATLDLDGSGDAAGDVPLGKLIVMLAGGHGAERLFDGTTTLPVDLDESDVLWLRAYCHLLGAMADFMLGYDWHEGYDTAFYGLFPSGDYPPSAVIDAYRADMKRLAELGPPAGPTDAFAHQDLNNGLTPEDGHAAERSAIRQRLDNGGIADLVAFIHLAHWPVADAGRLEAVHTHLKAMVALSRDEWKSILAETDTTSNELLPNPRQHGVLPGMQMDQARIDGWMTVLDQLDGLLDGTILIPHWRLDKGINLRRFFLEPTTFDPVLLIQGQAAMPYVEDGPKADPTVWSRIVTVFNGDFLRYFFWIN